ncbi:MAG: bifunctional protein-serine/threonine kinase/phosphatase [Candidatus Lambdaproteobacteria bacterium]|nr:bifunctional protein-serine/threonine kinase/phosphatase [Candidatus Lambdaproteobacteria bacterium]
MASQLRIRAGQWSQAGTKPSNEDSCGLKLVGGNLLATKGIAGVIADGVSGSGGGRIAAETTVQGFLSDYYSTPESWTVKTSCEKVLSALNRWLYGQGQQMLGGEHDLVTTLSALVLKSTTAHLFHVGDTRIYRLRNGALEQLTRDHRVRAGGGRSFLARAMGVDPSVQIDYRSLPVAVGDAFLLTSDGVHDALGEPALGELLADGATDPEGASRTIVERALAAGSRDNCTAQLLRVEELPIEDEGELYRQLAELPFPPPLGPGAILDGYRILRELHSSNRTQVFLARDTESGATCALKTPSVNFEDDPGYIERFRREEWAGRRIQSPFVLRVLEPARPRRFLYYVTEYLEGQTLRQWMHDHPHPPMALVRGLVAQLAGGLRAFHRLEMVHRDLKPENVLIDLSGQAKIIDFGSVRIRGLEEIATPLPEHHLLGTRGYTAPECFAGHPGDAASDQFSLAVVAYEMITGALPYGEGALTRMGKPRPYRSARAHAPDATPWLDGALRKALSWEPARRYGDVMEFVHDCSHPNPEFTTSDKHAPLLERDPLLFWRGLALLLLALCVLLTMLLLR